MATGKAAKLRKVAKRSKKTARAARAVSSEGSPLDPRPFPEIVIGLVGPVGIDLEPIVAAITQEIEAVEYFVKTIRLSAQLEKFFKLDLSAFHEDDRVPRLMDAGTRLRERSERGDAVALLAIAEIRRVRAEELQGKTESNAFILRSLKHPHEVQTLRSVYGDGFFLISVYTPRDARVSAMAEKITKSQHGRPSQARAKAELIVERDELEENTELGQDVKDAFPLADLFIDGRNKEIKTPSSGKYDDLSSSCMAI
jgi:hypothetical protein